MSGDEPTQVIPFTEETITSSQVYIPCAAPNRAVRFGAALRSTIRATEG